MSTEQQESRFDQPRKQWIKAIFWCVIYFLFIAWVGNYFWLVGLPVVFDAFITKYIPWTWWKKSKNKTVVAVMGWVDAIVFALVAVYFINTYLFQNYQIPTSSLEKTLLVGDFLFVSKASYGPRVPNTPLSFPLVQHTFPIINTKSYIEKPHWDYKRLKGFDEIERYDIVVFNFPAGDTVAINVQNPDYYSSCFKEGDIYYKSLGDNSQPTVEEIFTKGREIVKNKKAEYGEIIYRPVDRRENYVKRCVGLPGEFLQIKNRELYINNKHIERPEGAQHFCYIETTQLLQQKFYDRFGLSAENTANAYQGQTQDQKFVYLISLTASDQAKFREFDFVVKVRELNFSEIFAGENVYPIGYRPKWSVDNYGPIWIPKAGSVLKLTKDNLPIYEHAIRNYENNSLEVKGDEIYINGKKSTSYRFKMDYFWMMGDNRHNSADSRAWGFVPEDHVVGRPVLVWLSLNKDKGLFDGKIRFNRFFKNAER